MIFSNTSQMATHATNTIIYRKYYKKASKFNKFKINAYC